MRKKPLFQTLLTAVVAAVLIGAMVCRLPAVRAYLKNRAFAQQTRSHPPLSHACWLNLQLFESAKEQWASEYHKTTKDPPPTWDDLRAYVGRGPEGLLPECPCGGTYTLGRLDEPAKCSLTSQEHTYERMDAYEAKRTIAGGSSP